MPGRKYSQENSTYRYGFNGKEQDKETSSTITYDYGFRIYSPGLGRFLSVDPLTKSYPWYTPYQFAGNKPIIAIDLDGLEEYIVTTRLSADEGKNVVIEHVTKKGTKDAVNLQYRVVLTKDKNGNSTALGGNWTDKNVVRIVQQPDGKENVTYGKALNGEENVILKGSTKTKYDGPDNGNIWTINAEGKDYESTVKRDLKNLDENIAEKTYPAPIPHPVPFEGKILKPGNIYNFNPIALNGAIDHPDPIAVRDAQTLGAALKNTGIKSITITPAFLDASGGSGNNMQNNGKTFFQNYNEQFQRLGGIISRASGGVQVIINPPKVSSTSLAGQGLQITTQ